MKELKEMLKYSDLYGVENTILYLKKKFNYVSIAGNSIPTAGSGCKKLSDLIINENTAENCEILKTTIHRNETVTLRIKCFGNSVNNYRFHNLNL